MGCMIIHSAPQYHIYFGDAKDEMYPSQYQQWNDFALLSRKPIVPVAERLQLQSLLFLRQVHGIEGCTASAQNLLTIPSFSQEGDFLITHEQHVGLGILTADCLPVIAYDRKYNAIGIAHAGWRGAVAGVVPAMFNAMKKAYESDFLDLTLFFGPSAKRCCYEVQPGFITQLETYSFSDQVIHSNGSKFFFDLPLFVELQVLQQGVKTIHKEYNSCTICDARFHSYRRGIAAGCPDLVGRQMTVVSIK
jgi:polyphenol oxidase